MSVLQNPVRQWPFAVSAKLTRLLSLWRFDFQQKVWGLPVSEIPRDQPFVSPADAAVVVSVIIQDFPGYSASSELESRHSFRRPFQKKQNPKKETQSPSSSRISNQRSRDAGGGTSPLPALQNLQPIIET
jgi:hypothetical protein